VSALEPPAPQEEHDQCGRSRRRPPAARLCWTPNAAWAILIIL